MAVVEGECNPRFEEVKRVLNENLDEVLNLWVGYGRNSCLWAETGDRRSN